MVNGQKIWTSLAENAKYGILIARTNPDAPKHTGISYFIIPMNLPGIEIRPIRNMTGGAGFNEVFFTDVRVPVENLIGAENRGWGMAKTTLANERVSLSSGGLQWGHGPTARDLVELVAARGGVEQGPLRQRLVSAFIMGEILRYHHLRMLSAAVNKRPGPDASLRKALADPHGKIVFNLAEGPHGRRRNAEPGRALPRVGVAAVGGRLPVQPRARPSAVAPARCCATSSRSGCSASRTTPTWSRARPGRRPARRLPPPPADGWPPDSPPPTDTVRRSTKDHA